MVATGCAPLPTFDEVQEMTHAPMQQIVDLLPPDTEVEVLSKPGPGPCGGEGASYTAQWFATVYDGFDGIGFIDNLPQDLPDTFVVLDSGTGFSKPAVAFDYDDITLDVWFYDTDEYHGLYILAISGCAQLPPTPGGRMANDPRAAVAAAPQPVMNREKRASAASTSAAGASANSSGTGSRWCLPTAIECDHTPTISPSCTITGRTMPFTLGPTCRVNSGAHGTLRSAYDR